MASLKCSHCVRRCAQGAVVVQHKPCLPCGPNCSFPRGCRARAAPWSEQQDSQGDSMSLSDLKVQLDIAISEESFSEAARLRDRIQEISHDMQAAVEYANTRFYEAFKDADNDLMASAWGEGENVQCVHPGMAPLVGVLTAHHDGPMAWPMPMQKRRENVLEGWKMIFRGKQGMQIRISNVRVVTSGAMGFVTCEEHVGTDDRKGNVIVTNVFEKQGETWKMVHHHGSILSPATGNGLKPFQ